MEKLQFKYNYLCEACNLILRKSNKWKHENSTRHQNSSEIHNYKKNKQISKIEDIIKPIKECREIDTDDTKSNITMASSESSSVPPADIKQTSKYQRQFLSKLEYRPEEELIDRFCINSTFYNQGK